MRSKVRNHQPIHLLSISIFALCSSSALHANTNDITLSPNQIKQAKIQWMTLTQPDQSVAGVMTLNGQVVRPPHTQVMISTPVAGLINAVHTIPMNTVTKGMSVVTVYSPQIMGWQNELLQITEQRKLALANLEREKKLFSDGIIAEKRVFEAQSAFSQLNLSFQEKKRLLQYAGASTQQGLNPNITITSPYNGVVNDVLVKPGQHVEAGTPLIQISQGKQLWLNLQAKRAEAQLIQVGDLVKVEGCPASGVVKIIATGVNGATQNQLIQVALTESTSSCLNSEQFVVARVMSRLKNAQKNWSIPSTALIRQNGQSYIFVEKVNGFRAIPVQVQSAQAEQILVQSSELRVGQRIAMTGVTQIKAVWSGFGGDQKSESKQQ